MSLLGKVKRKVTRQKQKHIASLAALLAATLMAGQALAMPQGGSVVSGSVDISNLRNIIVNSNGIVEWNKFNIGTGEAVNFQFANSASGILNRVTGGTTAGYISTIAGTLSSSGNTGTVLLVNPAGIIFADGAVINVPTFIAGTGSINNDAFLNIMKDGNTATFSADGSTGKIQFNGNVTLQGSTDLVACAQTIMVAPGITITSTARDSGMSLIAADSTSVHTKVGDNGKYYLQFGGLSTKTGNDVTIGDSTGGATLNADYVTLMGNTINVNGSASSKSKLTSLGLSTDSSVDIIAMNQAGTDFSSGNIIGVATADNKVKINNAMLGLEDLNAKILLGDGSMVPTSARVNISGGAVDISNADFTYGNGSGNGDEIAQSNGAYIIACNKGTFEYTPIGLYKSLTWEADPNNTITITNSKFTTDNKATSRLALLGGKVDLSNTTASVGELFIGAGNGMKLESGIDHSTNSYFDSFLFSDTKSAAANGSTISLDANTNVTASSTAELYANSINNKGTMNLTNYSVFKIFNSFETTPDDNFVINVGSNNTIKNSGTINANAAYYITFVGNNLDNSGTIDVTNGHYRVLLADDMTGNQIIGGSGNLILGKKDPKYNSQLPFNQINEIYSGATVTYSFSRSGGIDSGASFEETKKNVEEAAKNITDDTNAGTLISQIAQTEGLTQAERQDLMRTVVYSYTPAREVMGRTEGKANGTMPGGTPIASNPAAVSTPANTSAAPSIAENNSNTNSAITVAPSDAK